MERIKVIVDTDPGTDVDDAFALAYLARHPRCELLGVTIVTGEADKRAAVAEAALRAAGRTDVPIHLGAEEPIGGKGQPECQHYECLRDTPHRMDRLGGTAVAFLRATILAHKGEVVLLTIGALTNIAELVRHEPEILTHLKEHVAMFGCWDDKELEWNFCVDPEAARIVLDAPSAQRRFVGHEVTRICRMQEEHLDQLLTDDCHALLKAMSEHFLLRAECVTCHDPLAAAAIFEPALCTWRAARLRITGPESMTADSEGPDLVATDVDQRRFFEHFHEVLGR